MWNISKQSFGFVLTFSGDITAPEMRDWVADAKKQLAAPVPAIWGVIVDMRELRPLKQDVQAVMVEGQKAFKMRGMQRSVVALKDPVTTMQFRRLARASGIDAWERYIDVSVQPNWQTAAKQWILSEVEPTSRV